ncbi:hypothetical protein TSUD_150800 [Trifolium subterraneum]|uniref:Uncharacterized protein n=1 Tax=Trifolium subterraneum TaxID=3900 RepID=A0A2Z6LZM6_TRISU|nr:hypothetical protein TSUD_150800 [Trifolium subterraneum]
MRLDFTLRDSGGDKARPARVGAKFLLRRWLQVLLIYNGDLVERWKAIRWSSPSDCPRST